MKKYLLFSRRVFLISSVIGILFCSSAYTQVCTGKNKNWNGAAWAPPGKPNLTDKVQINNPYDFDMYGSVQACTCEVGSQNLVITSGHYMEVENTITLTNGSTITVNHGGNLVQINPTATAPVATVKTETRPIPNHTWVHRSSPINNSTGDVFGLVPYGSYNYDSPQPSNQYRTGQIYVVEQAGTQKITDDSSLIPGKGFMLRTTGQRFLSSATVAGPNVNNTATSVRYLDFNGIVNNGTYTVPLHSDGTAGANMLYDIAGGDQNLIGNPYPSAIDIELFLSENTDIDGFIHYWTTPMIGNVWTAGYFNYPHSTSFATCNLLGGVTINGFSPKKYIAPGQGFSVYATCADCTGKNITFTNAMRVTTEPGGRCFAKKSNTEEAEKLWINLKDNSNELNSQILVGYVESSSLGYDRLYDAPVVNDESFKLYSVLDDRKLTIQGRGLFSKYDGIPLGFDGLNNDGVFEFSIDNLEGSNLEKESIILHDRKLDIKHNLTESKYYFTSDISSDESRFTITYKENSNEIENSTNNKVLTAIDDNFIVVKSNYEIDSVTLYDLSGRTIDVIKPQQNSYEIIKNINLNDSAYIVKIKTNHGTTTQQIINGK
ncbi:MAG: T9SS type A sorting domain-containing protein [Flavobacteriales bacterium]|nr:T9SS type A sorting domain-containing protein [Flavobacteriales bacterium]